MDMLEKVIKPELRIRALRAVDSMAAALAAGFLFLHLRPPLSGVKFFLLQAKIMSVRYTDEKAQSQL
jgi:hypothetical protein